MPKKILLTTLQLLLSIVGYAQLTVAKNVKLPADSTLLIKSLNELIGHRGANKDDPGIGKQYLVETSALLDEIRTIKGDQYELINVVPLDSLHYQIQIRNRDGQFKLSAGREAGVYRFSSPLRRNTTAWKATKNGNFIIHRNSSTAIPLLDRYVKAAQAFDKRLKAPNYTTEIFYTDSFSDVMALLGEEYRADLNGRNNLSRSWTEGGTKLELIGAAANDLVTFDLHDLWHDRLHQVVDPNIINRPIDEACAYLYGGSWGVYTWADILREFKTNMGNDRDWLKAFDEHRKFGGTSTPLYTDYVINAFIIQKIEKEQGFAKVITFLSCGKKEPGNANYFKVLKELTGIDRANFNQQIDALVK